MNRGLRNKRLLITNEEVDPLQGAINIVDAMLVFACGLMLSVIIHWNVDLGETGGRVDMNQGREVTQDQNIRDDLAKSQDKGQLYEKMGTVYKDPATGKMFMITK
jgi:hypothetical protein